MEQERVLKSRNYKYMHIYTSIYRERGQSQLLPYKHFHAKTAAALGKQEFDMWLALDSH